jgi:hypothetical protein
MYEIMLIIQNCEIPLIISMANPELEKGQPQPAGIIKNWFIAHVEDN